MCKYKPVEFQFNLEIERTARKLRTEHRNLKVATDIYDLQNIGNLNPGGEIEPISGQEGQNGHIIYGHLGNNNIIHMVDNKDRVVRDYAVLTP